MERHARYLFFLIAALSACGPDSQYFTRATPLIEPYPTSKEELCRLDNVMVSPDADYLVFELAQYRRTSYVSGSKDMVVASIFCLEKKASLPACATSFMGLDGMRLLQWSSGDKDLFAIENNSHLLRISFSEEHSRPVVAERIPVNREIADTVTIYGPIPTQSALAASQLIERRRQLAVNELSSKSVPIGVFLGEGFNAALGFDPNSLALSIGGDDTLSSTFTPLVRRPVLALSNTSPPKLVLVDDGSVQLPSSIPGVELDRSFSRAIINPENGHLEGFFQPSGQGNFEKQDLPLLFPFEAMHAFSRNKNAQAWINSDFAGRKTFHWKTLTNKGEYACNDDRRDQSDNRTTQKIIQIGSSKWPLAAVYAKQVGVKRTAILFGGGPAGSSASSSDQFVAAQNFWRAGWNVMIVAYSGSIGANDATTNRLRKRGLDALEEDVKLLLPIVAKMKEDDQDILIYGESFGALPAVHLSRGLDVEHRLVLVAPFAKHQDPREWIFQERTPFNPLSEGAQRRTEEVLLGISKNKLRLDNFLQKTYSDVPVHADVLLSFAVSDAISSREHFPPAWLQQSHIVKTPGTHAFSSSQPDLWSAIFNWIAKSDKSTSSLGHQ